jgi:hypothetical protein
VLPSNGILKNKSDYAKIDVSKSHLVWPTKTVSPSFSMEIRWMDTNQDLQFFTVQYKIYQ